MSFQLQPGAEGSLSESVHFPPTSSFHEHQGYHMDGRMAMAPPMSSASRALPRAPFLHDDGRGGPHYMHSGGFDRPEYDYGVRRHGCGDHLGLHSGTLIEHLLLQENQKALRMASLVQSQASGCLSGCLSCGLSEKRLRFKDSEERMMEEQRCYSRNVGEGPSRSVNLIAEADAVEYPDGWFRQPRPRQSIGGAGERSQSRMSFSEDELGRSLCQERRISYPVSHPTISHSQASHHVQEQQLHPVGAAESSVPIYGFSDPDGRVRQRWPTQRQTHSENGAEEDGWHRSSRSRVGPASAREQDRMALPGIATGSLPRTLVGSPHRAAEDSLRPPQSTPSTSQSLPVLPENSAEPSYQDNVVQQAGTQRVVTQGPVSLTNWYIIKVQIAEVGRVLETKVAVGGRLEQSGEHVKTSPIVNRLDIHKVVTEDGVEVSLEGSMDQETSTANGFAPGIVQCLSAGFPYMWKQLLRVRPVGASSGLAVSESLGGLHPKASKCLSEDESQGVIGPKTSKAIPEDMPCGSRDCEGNSPAPAVDEEPSVIQNTANVTSDVVEPEAAFTARAGTSGVVETIFTARAETSDATEAAVTARAVTSDAIETQCSPQDIRLQPTRDAGPTSLYAVPVTEVPLPATEAPVFVTEAPPSATEAPVEYLTTDSLSKEAESDPAIDTTLVTIRRGRKNKKGPLQPPVRSSRRLQQRQSRSSEFTPTLVDSLGPAQNEQVTSGMDISIDKFGDEGPTQIVPGVNQAQAGRDELIKTNSIIEEILKDLQQADTEAVDQGEFPGADPVCIASDPQPMEVEELGQGQDHCENVPKDSDGVEDPKWEEKKTSEDGSEGVIIETAPVAPPDLEKEEVEESVPVPPPELESEKIDETAPVAPAELENEVIEESAPVTPPELLQSKVQSRIGSLNKPSFEAFSQASEERVFTEFSARMTRSLKRRLKMTPITGTAANVAAPVTRSLKRLRRLSDGATPSVMPTSNPVTPHQEEGPNVEPISNPDTPHQEEVDAFYVRIRGKSKSSTKALSCSNCKQPCSHQDLLNHNSNVVSSELTPEQAVERALKMERLDYLPLASQHTTKVCGTSEQLNKVQTETCTMKRRSGRLKEIKPATRSVKSGTSRRLSLNSTRSVKSECLGASSSRGKSRRTSIVPPPLPPPRVLDKSEVPEAFGLKTSRSGRLLVPPLAYWRSQSIEYDKDGGIIAIFDGFQAKPADTGCFNFTPPQEKHAKRIQERLCKAAATVKKRK